jgi:hypothetical protein
VQQVGVKFYVCYRVAWKMYSIILKWIFERWDGEAWIGLLWLRIGAGGGRL